MARKPSYIVVNDYGAVYRVKTSDMVKALSEASASDSTDVVLPKKKTLLGIVEITVKSLTSTSEIEDALISLGGTVVTDDDIESLSRQIAEMRYDQDGGAAGPVTQPVAWSSGHGSVEQDIRNMWHSERFNVVDEALARRDDVVRLVKQYFIEKNSLGFS